MKNSIYITIALIVSISIYAFNNPSVNFKIDEPQGIQFQKGSWADALKTAKKENKYIFLDVYTTWCGYCKKLKKNTFSDKEVGTYFNQNFINVSVNGEETDGTNLVNQFNISGFPALLIFNSNGELVLQSAGYQNPKEIIEFAQTALNKK